MAAFCATELTAKLRKKWPANKFVDGPPDSPRMLIYFCMVRANHLGLTVGAGSSHCALN
jgi:hypothetical protein